MIQVHRLEGFYWVAKTRGYARAARAFPYPITQPAVHQQVKKLEGELGMALFERLGKDQLGLTPAGQALFDFCAPFYEKMPPLLRQIRAGEIGGELIIGSEALLLRQLMPAWLRRFQKKRPDARLDLKEILHPDPSLLQRGEVDVLVAWFDDLPDDLAAEKVGEALPYLVLPSRHPAAKKKNLSIKDLADEPFVGYHRDSQLFDIQMEGLRAHGVEPPRTVTAGSAETILGFVESGLGYSLVPWVLKGGPKGRDLLSKALTKPFRSFPLQMAWRRDTPENPLLDALIETSPRNFARD
ncbi:MAG: LysR family transcriptional regulator [Planctomycetota bacterium]